LKQRDLGPGPRGENDLEADSAKGWKSLLQAWVVLLLPAFTNGIKARRKLRLLKKKLNVRNAVLLVNDQDLPADILSVRTMSRIEL
jgi:hypothetical protein